MSLSVGARLGPYETFLQTPADEFNGQFSPDGKWIAYESQESGRLEVYVARSRPPAGARSYYQVSDDGKRFLVNMVPEVQTAPIPITVVVTAGLKK